MILVLPDSRLHAVDQIWQCTTSILCIDTPTTSVLDRRDKRLTFLVRFNHVSLVADVVGFSRHSLSDMKSLFLVVSQALFVDGMPFEGDGPHSFC